jgi:ribosomal protein S18 acetylase RimI-like enzyme
LDKFVAPISIAFATDPIVRWIFPDPDVYMATFPSFVEVLAKTSAEAGAAHLHSSGVASALWYPPGVHPDQAAVGATISPGIPPDRGAEIGAFMMEKGRYEPDEPHWYLHMLAVDPPLQGSGYGTALLNHALTAIDKRGEVAYLESTRPENIPLYERHGFELLAKVETHGSPPIWPMLRRAR